MLPGTRNTTSLTYARVSTNAIIRDDREQLHGVLCSRGRTKSLVLLIEQCNSKKQRVLLVYLIKQLTIHHLFATKSYKTMAAAIATNAGRTAVKGCKSWHYTPAALTKVSFSTLCLA